MNLSAPFVNAFNTTVTELRKTASNVMPYASERAEHLTDLGGLGLMAGANADRLRESLTGQRAMSDTGRDLSDLAGLGMMAVPSIQAARQLHRGGPSAGLAGGGSKLKNIANAASLAALSAPVLDRMQARVRGKGEEGQLMTGKQHALLELGGYGGLAAGVLHGKGKRPAADVKGHTDDKRLLAGYGLLAAPEAIHAVRGDHQEQPTFDMYGNPVDRPNSLRAATDMAGLGLLAAPSLKHLTGRHLWTRSPEDSGAPS